MNYGGFVDKKIIYFLFTLLTPVLLWAQSNGTDIVESTDEPSPSTTTRVQSTIKTPEPKKSRDFEKIEVTGSHIRRTDVEGPSPVIVIDRAQIEASGFNDVGSLLRASTATSFGGNGSTVSLRGLGSDRTLILINGHRAPKNGSSYGLRAASANFVPLAAVERVEILRDGASATYGSDALGGVVNIITRKNLDGVAFDTKYDISDPIGGDRSRTSVAYGTQNANTSFLTSFQYTYNQGTRLSSLDYRKGTAKTQTGADNFLTKKSGGLKAAPSCAPSNIDPQTGACIEDITPTVVTLPGHEVGNATTFTYDFSGNTQFYSTFVGRYNQDNSQSRGANLGTPGVGSGMTFSGAEAQKIGNTDWAGKLSKTAYSSGDDVRIYGRLGNERFEEDESYMGGLILGSRGYWGDSDWSWNVALNNQVYVQHNRRSGDALYNATRKAIIEGKYIPFSTLEQSTEGLVANSTTDSTYQVNWMDATSTGSIGQWAGASWSTAVGVSAANFEYDDRRDDRLTEGEFMGLSGVEGGGQRQLYAVYTEIAGMFGRTLETQLALRYDKYSDFGDTFNPKLAFRYQPTKAVMFRGSAGTGFNAPSLQDAYGPQLEGFYNGIQDTSKCQAAGGDPDHPDCDTNSYSARLGANRGLKEETSINYNLGVVVEPIKYLSFNLDYWGIKIEDTIYSGDPQKILELEAQGVDVSKYGAIIDRNENSGDIDRITLLMANAGNEEMTGLDVGVTYLMKTRAGDFQFGTEQTYLFHYYQGFYDELGKEDILGQNGSPRWRNVSFVGYSLGRFTGLLTARSTARNEKSARGKGFVDPFTQYDVNFDYRISKKGRVQLGAINVFDQRPNLDETTGSRINTALYRPFRTTYLAYRQEF